MRGPDEGQLSHSLLSGRSWMNDRETAGAPGAAAAETAAEGAPAPRPEQDRDDERDHEGGDDEGETPAENHSPSSLLLLILKPLYS